MGTHGVGHRNDNGSHAMHFSVNGQKHEIDVDVRSSVLDLLREQLGLTGSKKGRDHGPVRRL